MGYKGLDMSFVRIFVGIFLMIVLVPLAAQVDCLAQLHQLHQLDKKQARIEGLLQRYEKITRPSAEKVRVTLKANLSQIQLNRLAAEAGCQEVK